MRLCSWIQSELIESQGKIESLIEFL